MRTEDTESFDFNDVEDQGMCHAVWFSVTNIIIPNIICNAFVLLLHAFLSDQNPVLVIDQQVLEDEVQRIGEPVSAFLTSDEFTSVVPEDVQVRKVSIKNQT